VKLANYIDENGNFSVRGDPEYVPSEAATKVVI
jgi:hypothetical protein